MQRLLSSVGPAKPPADLGLRLRVAVSQERARTARHRLDIWQMYWQNSLAPLLARGAAGLATAMILLGTIGLMIGTVAAPPPWPRMKPWPTSTTHATIPLHRRGSRFARHLPRTGGCGSGGQQEPAGCMVIAFFQGRSPRPSASSWTIFC